MENTEKQQRHENRGQRRRAADNDSKLAYILGALYGDGCFAHKDQKGRIHFGASDLDFASNMISLIRDVFGLQIKLSVRKLSLKNRNWRDFYYFASRKLYPHIADYDWKLINIIPDFIKNGRVEVKSSFISGFFDAEGNVDLHTFKRKDGRNQTIRHVKCFSNDTELLREIKTILAELKINSNIFHGKKTNYYLAIWNYKSLDLFSNLIGFKLRRKNELLKQVIDSYKQIQTRWDFETYSKVMELRKQGLGSLRIKKELDSENVKIPLPTVEFWIYRGGKPLGTEVQQ